MLGATLATAMLPALAGTAAATQSLDVASRSSLTLDGDAHWWQQGAFDRYRVISHGDYQYTGYWDAADGSGDVYLAITRRTLSTGARETIILNTSEGRLADTDNPHNTISLGVAPNDGTLHVQWAYHNHPINYARSSLNCLTEARFSSCRFTWEAQVRRNETSVTYPMFANNADDELFVGFRSGTGTRGTWVWRGYDDVGHRWVELGVILDGLTGSFDLDGAWVDTNGDRIVDVGEPGYRVAGTNRGPYVDAIEFDPSGGLHLMWTWREPGGGLWDQHDVYYLYSPNNGLDWYTDSTLGTRVATYASDPVTVSDTAALVVSVPYDWTRVNQMRMAIDRDRQPHIVLQTSDVQTTDRLSVNLRAKHIWRTANGTWQTAWIESPSDGTQQIEAGNLFFDRANNAYYVWSKNRLGWYAWSDDERNLRYNQEFPSDHLIWDGSGAVEMLPTTSITQISTLDYIGLPIDYTSSTTGYRNLEIRVRNETDDTRGQLFFTTDSDRDEDWNKTVSFVNRNDRNWNTYRVSLSAVRTWTGTLRSLSFLPAYSSTGGSGRIAVDYIRFVSDDGRRVGVEWDFNQGAELQVAQADGADNWATWDVYDAAPGTNLVWYDAYSWGTDRNRYDRDRTVSFPALEQGAFGTELLKIYDYRLLNDNVAKQWGFGSDAIGWTAANHVRSFAWASDGGAGSLSGDVDGIDSAIDSPGDLRVPLGSTRTVEFRMKNARLAGQTAIVCWTTTDSPSWNVNRCSSARSITADGAYHDYSFSTSGWRDWRNGELRQLRIEPSEGRDAGTFNIDWVRIVD